MKKYNAWSGAILKILFVFCLVVGSFFGFADRAAATISSTPVQQVVRNTWTSGTTFTITLGSTPVNGNLLILSYRNTQTTLPITSVSQTGATWVKAISSSTSRQAEIWYAKNVTSASTTITVTMGGTPAVDGLIGAIVTEWSGFDNSNLAGPTAGSTTSNVATVTPTTGSITPTVGMPTLLIVAGQTQTTTAGPTNSFTENTNGSGSPIRSAYRVVSSASGSYSTSWTQTPSSSYELAIASFYGVVASTNPVPTITSPLNNASAAVGSVTLTGSGTDAEDGTLTGSSLSWSSSIDGVLGTGTSISPTLSAGLHTITLTATDSGSNTGTATITLYVGTAASLTVTVQPHTTRTGLPVTPGIQITAKNAAGATDTNVSGSVVISKVSGSGTLSGTLSGSTLNFVSGIATASNVIITGTGAHVLKATASVGTANVNTASYIVREIPYTTTGDFSTPSIFFENTSEGADADIYYQFFVPTVANGATSGNALPLLIYIGGSGSNGQDHAQILTTTMAQEIAAHKTTFPYLTLLPQIPAGADETDTKVPTRAAIPQMIQMLRDDGFNIDMTKIFFMGYSTGGINAFHMAYMYPDLFAAVIPVDGSFAYSVQVSSENGTQLMFGNPAVTNQATAEAEWARKVGPSGTGLLFEHAQTSDSTPIFNLAGLVSAFNAAGYPFPTVFDASPNSNVTPSTYRTYDIWDGGVDHGTLDGLSTNVDANTNLWYAWLNARQRPANTSSFSSGTPGSTTATISWNTDRATNSIVQYGTTTSYGSASSLSAPLTTSHSRSLTSLSPSTTYHYRVVNADTNGNTGYSSDQTFTTAAADSTPPTVSITTPTDGATVSGASVSVAASASDNVGVVGVQFKDGSTNIGSEDTTSSYGVTWDTTAVTDGSHVLTAVARDAATNSTTSSSVTVTVDNTAPVRSAGSPTGTLSIGTTSTSMSLSTNEAATCKYNTSPGIAYSSMTSFNTTGSTTHSSTISGLTDGGSYIYYVKCRDGQSNTNATDYAISFTVAADSTSPTVSITAPANSEVVSGSSVPITANATDDVSVSGVQFKLDGSTNIGSEDTTSTYGVTWDTTAVTDGNHSLTAVARDGSSNTTTSSVITVTVDNTAPVRSLGSPSGTLSLGTTSTSVSLTTNENATCKYSTTASTAYGSMISFNTTGNTSHSSTISGLTNGGSYNYYVKCADGEGNINVTDYTISFTVAADLTSPTVLITSPSNGDTVSGSSVSITASASDDVAVIGVQFKIDGSNFGPEDTTSAYAVTWDTTGASDGSHTITAVARDGSGNNTTASTITVTVDNTTPAPEEDDGPRHRSSGGGGGTTTSVTEVPSNTLPADVNDSGCANGNAFSSSTGRQCIQNKTPGSMPPVYIPVTTAPGGSITPTAASLPIGKTFAFTQAGGLITVKNHTVWDTGEDIRALQRWLNSHGFIITTTGYGSPGHESATLGPLTVKALARYQASIGLPATGYFGPLTRASLNF